MSIVRQLTREFHPIKDQVKAAYVAVGMITKEKFDYFMRGLANCPSISILTGIHMPTPPDMLQQIKDLTDIGTISSGIYTDNFFHPKLYIFQLETSWIAFVGSGNFTNGGWASNEELFIKTIDSYTCQTLKEQFNIWMAKAVPIDDSLISKYRETYQENTRNRNDERRSIDKLIASIQGQFDIDNINFDGQYFSKQDHLAFAPGKTHLDTPEILEERNDVRNKLYHLSELLERKIPPTWVLHPHYKREHLVAHIRTEGHHEENVRALWLAYGRNERDLKKYGETDTTPLRFMRMQVIIGYDYIGIWLMPGKSGGGQIDRENLRRRIKDQRYREQFFFAFKALGDDYWMEIANDEKSPKDFNTPEELKTFIETDNWRHYYFTIGRNYTPGSPETRTDRMVDTILSDYGKYLPLYNLILDKSME